MISIPKSAHHRYRYIAFTIHSKSFEKPITRKDMISSLRSECKSLYDNPCSTYGIFLTRFQQNKGIVRCFHLDKTRTIEVLKSITTIDLMDVEVETLGTSGTIKSLIKKHLDNHPLIKK